MKELASMNHIFFAFVLIGTIVAIYTRKRRRIEHLPPGPPGQFLIGNALQLPVEYQWKTFAEWGKKYGIAPTRTAQCVSAADDFERKPFLHALLRSTGHCMQ